MAFLRFSRDKRGYEYFTLVEPINRRGRSVSRVLYWFRTPPDVKVGRQPFDDSVRRALETQNPGVSFDWRAILETPIPAKGTDHLASDAVGAAGSEASLLSRKPIRPLRSRTRSSSVPTMWGSEFDSKPASAAERRRRIADRIVGRRERRPQIPRHC